MWSVHRPICWFDPHGLHILCILISNQNTKVSIYVVTNTSRWHEASMRSVVPVPHVWTRWFDACGWHSFLYLFQVSDNMYASSKCKCVPTCASGSVRLQDSEWIGVCASPKARHDGRFPEWFRSHPLPLHLHASQSCTCMIRMHEGGDCVHVFICCMRKCV